MKKRSQIFPTLACLLAMLCMFSEIKAQPRDFTLRNRTDGTQELQARQILDATGIKGGLVVHIGCGNGQLTAGLHASDSYLVHGLDTYADNVEKARRYIWSLGLYGKVSVEQFKGDCLPYTDNLVNLVVSENLGGVSMDEVLRVLCPNGVAYIKTGDTWIKTVKPRPEEIDEWTHYMHDAGGNAVAHDSVVGPPRRFQWVGSPRWSRHHDRMASMSACVSAGGRIFYIIDEGSRASIQMPSKWTLIARDAFNGTILWKRPIYSWLTQYWPFKSGPAQLPRRLVAVGDRVYVTLGLDGTSLSELDAATGETVRTYNGTQMTEELIFSEGVLFLMVKESPPATRWNEYVPIYRAVGQAKSRVASEWPWDEANRRIMAVRAETGVVLWQKECPVAPLTLAANSKCVFFHNGQQVVCLDRGTGNHIWISSMVPRRSPMPANFGPTLVVYNDVVLFAGGNSSRTLTALSAQNGRTLWTSSYEPSGHNCPHDLLVVGGLAWAGATAGGSHSGIFTGWDPHTGEIKRQFSPDVDTYWFHHRCYRSKATDRYILPSRTGIEFIDLEAEHWIPHHWVRGGCLYGIMPCNGLIYAPPHDCACYAESKLSGFCALAPEYTDRLYPQVVSDEDRLESGPAYEEPIWASSGLEDWPTYRHDPARSGYTQSIVPSDLKLSWQIQLEGKLTSLVIANGKVYVASVDAHTLYALNEDDGQVLWSFTAGGRVDSPPTIYNGRVFFGSADGWVYCLRASDGELIWRFQAAPQDVRLTAFEQMESVWPVQGSVLVQNDPLAGSGQAGLYCVAGRSMFLDGGLRLLCLDPVTGSKLSENILDDRDPETGENLQVHVKGLNMPVALPDVLSSDGQYLFMRSQRFAFEQSQQFGLKLYREQIPPHSSNHTEQGSQQYGEGVHLFCPFGFLDDTWFHRSYWVFGKSFASGAGGYYRAGRYAPAGRILAFDESCVYGFGREPQYYKWTTPLEYHLFAADKIISSTKTPSGTSPGGSKITVEKSESLNPAGKPLAVEAWVKAERSDGAILARGGNSHGYALVIQGGQPRFVVRVDGQVSMVSANDKVVGEWVHLAGVLNTEKELQIYVNGELSAAAKAYGFIASDPSQAMQIGADDGSAVGEYSSPFVFTGIIDELRVYHGTVSAAEILEHCSTPGQAAATNAELVLCMSFDKGDATDDSGNNNHGKLEGALPTQGKFGSAMRFTGSLASWAGSPLKYRWSQKVPLLVRAMVLADRMLFIAGPPDVVDEEEAFDNSNHPDILAKLKEQDAALEGQKGALLWAVSVSDGSKLAGYDLESLPVWDGMAAANGRLYISMNNSKVKCFVGSNYPPKVNAGENQSIYPMATAVLDATVTDDGLPKVDPCDPYSNPIGVTTNWIKSEGPGEVTFDDPCAVDTTALFSQWGQYNLRLIAFDGGASYYDDIKISVLRPGDLDFDNDVDIFDLDKLVAQWLCSRCDALNNFCSGADQTDNGIVDFGDYAVSAANWLSGVYPEAAANLTAEPGYSRISLDWDDSAELDFAGYNVYRSLTSGSGYTRINQLLLINSEYVDTTVTNCITYYYVVTAEDAFGYESVYSNEVTASGGVQPVMKLLAGIGVITTGADVSKWEDQAKSNDAAQSTEDDRPVLISPAINDEPAIEFDGTGEHLDVSDSGDINTGGPYSGKTLVVVFKTGSDIISRQVIWEQGGGVRGLSFYLDSGNLYINGWNLGEDETQWGPTALNTAVLADSVYVAVLMMDADAGTFEGFVNGMSIGSVGGIAQLHSHGNDCAFGHVEGATKFHDGSKSGPANFEGQIAEFYQYSEALSSSDRQTIEGTLMNKYGAGSGHLKK